MFRECRYDLNTVRLNLRPAVGIFKTEWDAMQTSHPRVVVAESSMDYLAMSYADMDLAQALPANRIGRGHGL